MVNTVTGPIEPTQMGKTLMHEHIIFGYPGYQGDITYGPFKKEEAMTTIQQYAEAVKAQGVKTIIDATPNECGRDPEFLQEVSKATGLQIVCSTGFYYEGEGATAYFKFRATLTDIEKEIYDMMMTEVTEGIAGTGIKAGVIKLASSKGVITDYEMAFFRAGAKVQKETGVTIITHTQEGTMGPQQAELLIGEGANPERIMIGHMDGNTDPSYHLATLKHGVNVAFDRCGLQGMVGMPMDEQRVEVFATLIKEGYAHKLNLSHDTIWHWLGRPLVLPPQVEQLIASWNPLRVFEFIIPSLLAKGVTQAQIDQIMEENPKNLFE